MRRTKLISILFMPAALLTTRALTQGPPGPPPPPAGNPTTPDKVLLGKALFFEEQLSSTRAVSCATCHVLERGGGDPRTFQSPSPGHDGIFGTPDDGRGSPGVVRQDADGTYLDSGSDPFEVQVTGRKAQPVVDAAFSRLQFWDGRSGPDFVDPVSGAVLLRNTAGLEAQAAGPPVSDIEMAHFGETWPNIATRITAARPLALATDLPAPLEAFVGDGATSYPDLFDRVFGSREVTPARIIMAIAAYERTLISANAPIDRFLAGDTDALTPQERRGFNTFNAARCDRCHAPPLFAVPDRFHFIGVRPPFEDPGRFAITGNPADRGAFKIPSLRNVERRAPYLHNGSEGTLAGVVNFYNRGGNFPNPELRPLRLSPGQRADLAAFLGRPLTDPRVAAGTAPFDRPTLWSENAGRRARPFGPASGLARLTTHEPALLGNSGYSLAVSDGPSGALPDGFGVLFVGLARASIQLPGVTILTNAAVSMPLQLLPTTANGGSVTVPLPLPNDRNLNGVALQTQAVFLANGGSGLTGTRGLEIPMFAARGR